MSIRSFCLLLCVVFWPSQLRGAEKPAAQWVAVTAPAFRDAIEPLCEQRRSQGLRVVVVQTTDVLTPREIRAGDAHKLRDKVNRLCREAGGTSYVLLVGAVEAGSLADAARKVVPTLPGTAGRMKGEPSDNGYGSPGTDLLPAVAVGRMPARTEKEAQQMVRKTLAYERNALPGPWRRQITILAGVPAFNPFVDKLVERVAMARLDRLDPSWSGHAIYHNAQSHFCVPDDRLHDLARQYVQEGQAFTLYLGHSDARAFYAGTAPFLDRNDWADMKIARGPGIFATFGCLGCRLNGEEGEGYGLAAMRNPDGPVAVIGSHGICFAAIVQLAADGLFEGFFAGQPPGRLGEAWLHIQAGVAKGKIDDLTFHLLDAVDGDSRIPQATQRLEHLEMFTLLGDPALRLPLLATDIKLNTQDSIAAGRSIKIKGELPARLAEARVRLTLERSPSSEPADMEPLPSGPADERARVMMANHARANRFVLSEKEVQVRDGHLEASLDMPAKVPWPRLIVRAYAANDRQEALGVVVLTIGKRGEK